MLKLDGEKFFFFGKDIANIQIYSGSAEHAYIAILDDQLDAAKKIFSLTDSPRTKWGYILVSILEGYLEIFPTFFQIRNFLEIDLDFLIRNEKISYVEQLLGALDFLAEINQETYKFAARVMFENKLYSSALKYMERSKNIHYNDPELHFMLAKYYINVNDYNEAYANIQECLRLLPDYYPALRLKQEIEQIGF